MRRLESLFWRPCEVTTPQGTAPGYKRFNARSMGGDAARTRPERALMASFRSLQGLARAPVCRRSCLTCLDIFVAPARRTARLRRQCVGQSDRRHPGRWGRRGWWEGVLWWTCRFQSAIEPIRRPSGQDGRVTGRAETEAERPPSSRQRHNNRPERMSQRWTAAR